MSSSTIAIATHTTHRTIAYPKVDRFRLYSTRSPLTTRSPNLYIFF
ncbi:MAG: hypothetical protein ACO3NK_04575 [Prochlorotrichaceae cyanobacterium]